MEKMLLSQASASNALANREVKINFMGNFDLTNKVMDKAAHDYKDAIIAGKAGSWIKARAIDTMCDKANYAKDNDFETQKDVCRFLDISQASATQAIKAVYLASRIPSLEGLTVKTVYNMYRYLVDKTGNIDKVTAFLILCGKTLNDDVNTFEEALPYAIDYLRAFTDSLAELLIKCYSEHNTLYLEDKTEEDKTEEVKPSIGQFIQSVVGWNNTHPDDIIRDVDIVQVMYGLGMVKVNSKNTVTYPIKVDSHK